MTRQILKLALLVIWLALPGFAQQQTPRLIRTEQLSLQEQGDYRKALDTVKTFRELLQKAQEQLADVEDAIMEAHTGNEEEIPILEDTCECVEVFLMDPEEQSTAIY